MMIQRILWFTVLVGIEALSLGSLVAFVFTGLVWAGYLRGVL